MIQTYTGSAVHVARDRGDQNPMIEGVSAHITQRDSFDMQTTRRVGGLSERELA